MSGLSVPPLTQARVEAAYDPNGQLTQAGVAAKYDPNGQISAATVNGLLSDAGISAVLSPSTVGAKVAGITPGGVGSLIWGNLNTSAQAVTFGATYPGSNLLPNAYQYQGASGQPADILGHEAGTVAGTWVALSSGTPGAGYWGGGLFVRVA